MACCALLAVVVGVILAILTGRNPRRHNADALKWRLHTRDKDESE
jgi:uncharacterized membrane protein affecting hemolysin expression